MIWLTGVFIGLVLWSAMNRDLERRTAARRAADPGWRAVAGEMRRRAAEKAARR